MPRLAMPNWSSTAVLFGMLAGLASAPVAMAQTTDLVTDPLRQTGTVNQEDDLGLRNGNIVVAPIPFSSPALEAGLALGVGYLFKLSPEARTSVVGLGAMQTQNGSEARALLANLAFDDNRWLLDILIGDADIRYDLVGGRVTIPLRQTGELADMGVAFGVTPQLSFGGRVRYLDTQIELDFDPLGPITPDLFPTLDLEVVNFSLTADWDRRDDTDYPTRGTRLYGEATQAQVLNADERQYQIAIARLDGYAPLGDKTVLAGRAVTCGATDDTPFFDKCSIGITDSFRGFNGTRFQNDRLLSLQLEVRHRFTRRIGAVAFAGTGWSGASFDALWDNGANSAGGVGLRYRISRDFPVDFSVDVSRNNLDENQIYIYVGQRF